MKCPEFAAVRKPPLPCGTTAMWPDLKYPASTHTISNLRFHQKSITGSIYHCVPCSKVTSLVSVAAFLWASPEWHYGVISWSWSGAQRAGQCLLESCQHMKGPVGLQLQTVPLAFNCLHIPFCPIITMCNIITITNKAAQNNLNFGCLKVIHHKIIFINYYLFIWPQLVTLSKHVKVKKPAYLLVITTNTVAINIFS